jgi:hypothetical protein
MSFRNTYIWFMSFRNTYIYINDICIRFPSRVIGMLIIIRHVEKHNKGREACWSS